MIDQPTPIRHVRGLGLADLVGRIDESALLDMNELLFRACKQSMSEEEAKSLSESHGFLVVDAGDSGELDFYDVYVNMRQRPAVFRVEVPMEEWLLFEDLRNRFEEDAKSVLECSVVGPGEGAEVRENARSASVDLFVLDSTGQIVWSVAGISSSLSAVAEAVKRHPRDT